MEERISLLTCGAILLLLGILLFLFRSDRLLASDDIMSEQEKQQKHDEREKFIKNMAMVLIVTGTALLLLGLFC